MDFLIHASKERMWYVNKFLLPRLYGIPGMTYCDSHKAGNIRAYLDSLGMMAYANKSGNTWHLEDDVFPDKHFVKWAREHEDLEGIICGFGTKPIFGRVLPKEMWYSFPCIRIPNDYALEFAQWVEYSGDADCERRKELGKGIDFLFNKYVQLNPIRIYHPNHCMVEHVDDLIGGSLINERTEPIKAIRFEDKEGLEQLKLRLQQEGRP